MFHTLKGEPYWDESAAYQLSSFEVDQLELAANTLHEMCLDLVQEVIDQRMFGLFLIPKEFEEMVIRSWQEQEPSIYGRFDLAYDGVGAAEAAGVQRRHADGPARGVDRPVAMAQGHRRTRRPVQQHPRAADRGLAGAARAGRRPDPLRRRWKGSRGLHHRRVPARHGHPGRVRHGLPGRRADRLGPNGTRTFVDRSGRPIHRLFKLYPWEWIIREEFGQNVLQSPTRWVEPAWKMILSCKSILPMLYERHPESPYLLPASFEPLEGNYVRKPVHAREGANITVVINGQTRIATDGVYTDGPSVYQALAPMKAHDGRYPVFGTWIVNGVACGLGIREDATMVTQNTSRFVPHQMVD